MRGTLTGPPAKLEGDGSGWLWIDAEHGASRVNLRELFQYRDLLYFLTWRDISVRYRQTVLGVLWAILQPFVTMVIFSVFLGTLVGVPSDGVPYPVFSYLGLLPWMYFSGAVTRSAASLVGNANLLTRIYFPRVLMPLSATLSALVDFAVSSLVLAALMAWYGLAPAPTIVLLIPLIVATAFVAGGVGMGLAALNVRFRDVQHAIPFLMQFWMFATPVVYPAGIIPDRWRPVFALNPMTGLISAYRAVTLGDAINWSMLGVSLMSAVAIGALGIWLFRRMESTFADVV